MSTENLTPGIALSCVRDLVAQSRGWLVRKGDVPGMSVIRAALLDWRAWRGEDTYGYTLSVEESGDGYRVHLKCRDKRGKDGTLCARVGPPHDPPPGVTLVSYGGGFLDPEQARALAAALIAYADEKDGEP